MIFLCMGEMPRHTVNLPDLPYLLIHDMMAATKINSFESDRCPMIAMENETWHVERGISSSQELDFQKI